MNIALRPGEIEVLGLRVPERVFATLDASIAMTEPMEGPFSATRAIASRIAGEMDASGAGGNIVFIVPDDGWKYLSSGVYSKSVEQLEAENARLRADAQTASYNRNRLEEFDGLTAAAENLGYDVRLMRELEALHRAGLTDVVRVERAPLTTTGPGGGRTCGQQECEVDNSRDRAIARRRRM